MAIMWTPVIVLALSSVSLQTRLTDPVPPMVHELKPLAAPDARPFPELTRGQPAKPLANDATTQDWPSFMGPNRDGKTTETKLLERWPAGGPVLVWAMQRGAGYSSPAIYQDKLVYSHQGDDGQTLIDCMDAATGERFWRVEYEAEHAPMYPSFAGPRSTPIVQGNKVWIHGLEGVFHCLELSTGRTIWKRDLKAEFGLEEQFFGVASSPLLVGDLLIINLGAPEGPCVAAFDKSTGRLVWGTKSNGGMSCASPVIAPLHREDRLFVLTGGKSQPPKGDLLVIDPRDGELMASFPFRSRTYNSVNGCNPVVVDSTVFLTSKYSTGSIGVRLDKDAPPKQAWKARRLGIEFATPIAHDGKLFLVDGVRNRGGAVVCLDPLTGEELTRTTLDWEEKVEVDGQSQTNSASIGTGSLFHLGGDRFLCLGDNGHLLLLECTEKKTTVLERTALFHAKETWTPLALSRGLLYVCQNKPDDFDDTPPRLLCFDLRAERRD